MRPATKKDIDAVAVITRDAQAGLTTVPRGTTQVGAYIEESLAFLAGEKDANRLLFVLEVQDELLGISGIIPRLGSDRPFYNFKRSRYTRRSQAPKISVTHDMLSLCTDFDGYSELATLYVASSARGRGAGRLLSYGRVGFMLTHPYLFGDLIMAEIRGWFDNDGRSPFWDHLTSKFILTDFEEADRLSLRSGGFIADLIPTLPIILNLLPDEVIEVVGKPNDNSRAALRLLEQMGLSRTDMCDVFDGGPAIAGRASKSLIGHTKISVSEARLELFPPKVLHFGGQGQEFRALISTDKEKLQNQREISVPIQKLFEGKEHWLAHAMVQ